MNNIFKEKGGQKTLLVTIGIALILASIILIIWFLTQGQTTVSGSFNGDQTLTSLSCTAKNFSYPFFEYEDTNQKETEINAIFNDDNKKLDSISLTQKLYYASDSDASGSEARNHAAMNKSFGTILGADALNANYYSGDRMMRFQIYITSEDYNGNTRKYFLINTTSENMKDIEKNYINQGFTCEEKQNN